MPALAYYFSTFPALSETFVRSQVRATGDRLRDAAQRALILQRGDILHWRAKDDHQLVLSLVQE